MKIKYGLLSLILVFSLPVSANEQISEEQTNQQTEQQGSTENLQEASGLSSGTVYRAAFTSQVQDREPTNDLEKMANDQSQLYFFTELRDMSGQTAKHRWEYDGKIMAEVKFKVNGPRWRVWSSKSFVPGWTGDWKVSVINDAGDVIKEKNFTYEVAAAEQTETTTSEETATMPEMKNQ